MRAGSLADRRFHWTKAEIDARRKDGPSTVEISVDGRPVATSSLVPTHPSADATFTVSMNDRGRVTMLGTFPIR